MFTQLLEAKSFARKVFAVVCAAALVCGALSILGCSDGSDNFVDNHKLNSALEGHWVLAGEYPDEYTITSATLSEGDSASTDEWATNTSASIEYVYNFSKSAGAIIVKYNIGSKIYGTDVGNKYSAVYFGSLTATTAKFGNAYDVASMGATAVEVATLEAAKTKFAPANIALCGGELSAAAAMTKK
jgi:hypothetical protein